MSGATNNVFGYMAHPHIIIVDGVIGVGKSSLIKSLSEKLNALVIPEYIEESVGVEKLNEYLNDKPAYAYSFQHYILNHYRRYINYNGFGDYDYVLIERDPLRGVKFFAGMDYNNGYISLHEYNDLFIDAINIMSDLRHSIGDMSSGYILTYDTSNKSIDEVSDDIIRHYLDSNEIRLTASTDIIYNRINKRNREGENSAYDNHYINNMCEKYFG